MHEINRKQLDRKIRVAAVSYLNTKPLIYGFEKGMIREEIELLTDFPANIGDMLLQDKVDIALVPVAVIPLLKEHFIISDYCIGTEGEVASVCLFSEVPLKNIKSIFLDYQSRTSVALLKILLRDHWKINPALEYAEADYEKNIQGSAAGLVIGDRAFIQRKKSKYIYDLGLAWKELTGLSFVFAAWVANKELEEDFVTRFNKTTGEGLNHLPEIIKANPYKHYDLEKYFTENINFMLNDNKRKGMEEFLNKL